MQLLWCLRISSVFLVVPKEFLNSCWGVDTWSTICGHCCGVCRVFFVAANMLWKVPMVLLDSLLMVSRVLWVDPWPLVCGC